MTERQCKHCGEIKPVGAFRRDRTMPDGYRYVCLSCTAKQNAPSLYAYRERNRAMVNAKRRERHHRTGYKRHIPVERERIYGAVKYAVKTGRLQKPDRCNMCGANGRLHGHHRDYSKPLEVMWMCTICHGMEHRKYA